MLLRHEERPRLAVDLVGHGHPQRVPDAGPRDGPVQEPPPQAQSPDPRHERPALRRPFFGSFLTSLSRFFGSLTPNSMDDRPVSHVDRCLRQAHLGACGLDILNSRADMLNVARLVECGGNQRVERHGLMFVEEPGDRLARRELARIPHFDAIREHPHLHRRSARVVAMCDGVDDHLANCARRDFVCRRRLDRVCARANGRVDMVQDEDFRLVDLVEKIAFINLQDERPAILRPRAAYALDFCRKADRLRILAEQHDCGAGKRPCLPVHEFEMNKQLLVGLADLGREFSFSSRRNEMNEA